MNIRRNLLLATTLLALATPAQAAESPPQRTQWMVLTDTEDQRNAGFAAFLIVYKDECGRPLPRATEMALEPVRRQYESLVATQIRRIMPTYHKIGPDNYCALIRSDERFKGMLD